MVAKTVIRTQRKLRMAILVSFITRSHSEGDAALHLKATALIGRRSLKDCS
jgi:hypothetical protein